MTVIPQPHSTFRPLAYLTAAAISQSNTSLTSLHPSLLSLHVHHHGTMPLELWASRISWASQRVFFAAAELHFPLRVQRMRVLESAQKLPAHLERQPFGKVPAASYNGVSFYESRAICRIMHEARSQAGVTTGISLMPSSLADRALFEQWASLEGSVIGPKLDTILLETVFKPLAGGKGDRAVVSEAMEEVRPALEVLDKQLASTQQFIVGPQLSLVDVFVASAMDYLSGVEEGRTILST